MGFLETAGSISAAEKIGWLGLIGGFCIAAVKVVRWIASFQSEHDEFKRHLVEAELLIPRFLAMEESSRIAQVERHETLKEIRGLRQDLKDLYTMLIDRA